MSEALLGLGGNVGDVRATLDAAIARLADGGEVKLIARSSDYRTPPWGVAEQPPFVNCALAVETSLSPHALLARAQDWSACSAAIVHASNAGVRAQSTSTCSRMTILRSTSR